MRHGLDAQSKHYDAATSSERVSTAVNASAAAYTASADASRARQAHRDHESDVDVDSSDSDSSGSGRDDLTVHVAVTVFEDDANDLNSESEEVVVSVDRLLQYRVQGGVPQYSVRWVGGRDDSWEPEDEMSPALVRVFWRGSTSREGQGPTGFQRGKRKKKE